MGLTTVVVGGSLGFAAQCISNAIQKIPTSRRKFLGELFFLLFFLSYPILSYPILLTHSVDFSFSFSPRFNISFVETVDFKEPWMHVLCTVGGAYGATKWVSAKEDLLADVNEIRAYKGLPPMVGTRTFFPFVPPTHLSADDINFSSSKR